MLDTMKIVILFVLFFVSCSRSDIHVVDINEGIVYDCLTEWQQYEDFRGGEAGQEAVAHRDAMMAVQRDHVYHEETGAWYRKGEEPEEEEEQGFIDSLKEMVEDL